MRPFNPLKVPRPPDFQPLRLDPGRPIDVEIGCGVGFHPIRYARENPGRQLVAIERTSEKFAKFQGRLRGHDPMPNLTPVHGDAVAWISHGFTPGSVDRFFILYPNPYPKGGQRNLRFHRMPFFSWLVQCLKPGGEITLATNQAFYAEEAEEWAQEHWGLKLAHKTFVPGNFPPRTHFEKKYLARGEPCFNLVFVSPGN